MTLAWAFEDQENGYPDVVLESLAEAKACVPIICPLEVGNALLIAERRGRFNQAVTVQFLALFWQLPICRTARKARTHVGRNSLIGKRARLSTYDATYLHLAMRQGFPLATTDELLRQAVTRAGVPLFERSTTPP